MLLFYIIIGVILAAGLFLFLVKLTNLKEKELFTEDVVDDDIDDAYWENDWNDVRWDVNEFEENEFKNL